MKISRVSSCKYLGIMFVTGLTLHVDCGYVKKNLCCLSWLTVNILMSL